MNKRGLLIVFIIILSSVVYAHEESPESSISLWYIAIGSLAIFVFVVISLISKKINKAIMFTLIVIPILVVSFYLVYSTISLNLKSDYNGPVHWHADFEIWNCGEKINLMDPEGMSNRIGTSVFHEHNDNRIHVEGVIINKDDVNLHEFFETFGSELNKDMLIVETNQGIVSVKNGDRCNNVEGKLQVFLYKVKNPEDNKNWIYEQVKLQNFDEYVLSPYSNVPSGDCIIIEFDQDKDRTDKICETYEIAIKDGDLIGS
nr:hypothetical protein [Candidatus Woesearchaeota archaeon]